MPGELHVVFRPDGTALAAIPARFVRETMRPLPVEPLAGAPAFVTGAAIVRGRAVPVLDAAQLVSGSADTPRRWIAIEVRDATRAGRTVILAVHDVVGVQPLRVEPDRAPLLGDAAQGAIAALSSLDGELLAILRAARLVDLGLESALKSALAK